MDVRLGNLIKRCFSGVLEGFQQVNGIAPVPLPIEKPRHA